MSHWWHHLCGACGKRVVASGKTFCDKCDQEADAELDQMLERGDQEKKP